MLELKFTIPAVLTDEHRASIRKIISYLLSLTGDELVGAPEVKECARREIKLTGGEFDPDKVESNDAPENLVSSDGVTLTRDESLVIGNDGTIAHIDASGAIWNPSIHARTKTKDAKGNWKLKRQNGLQPKVEQAQVELPPPPPAEPQGVTYATITQKITKAVTTKILSQLDVKQILERYGIQSLPLLADRQDLFNDVAAAFDAAIAERQGGTV